ncbi:NAD(P)-dependent oxidoreductase [Phytoactinopolyspora alkaliphila]|uniref:NAD(P)-dependent oxidoreductase n=1 Tax=Phytoactinopolyspora alkaliphila TaxID=1783498 RepID=A0A6N9YGL7_9ACTN|nr:NAD(P)-dependent oxidoreductase [Phytoactinopolyspora alkaliphila]NED94112.1 NAD(P)-dependent oxidoreductase [Phytoactinopolyspora alkaliphila]
MQHALITGAAGLIGRATASHLRDLGFTTTGLVLEDPGDVPVDRVVVGDATDRSAVITALDGVDAVIHLAAIPSPSRGTADEVFAVNTQATFTVLDAAGEAGITHAAIASSINALGYRFGPVPGRPDQLPLHEGLPSQAADPYSLSKLVDEATAAAMARRHGMTVVALRFPMVGSQEGSSGQLRGFLDHLAANPADGATDFWLYLDDRDAARALALALSPNSPHTHHGTAHVAFVAASLTSVPYPTEQLIDRYHPGVPRTRVFPGRAAPVDLSVARELLGFTAEHVVDLPELELP